MAIIRELVKLRPTENPWITYMKRQVYVKNNCINGITVGVPGSGKSWGNLSMCAQIDPDFELEGNWFFKASDFMDAIKTFYDNNRYKKGKIWVLDEAGVDLNNLSYFDEINKGLNIFFQTARHRNYIFFGTVPFMTFISKGVRKLMTTVFRAEGWDKKDKTTTFIPRIVQYNDELDRFYKRRLLVNTSTGITMCNKIRLPKPPKRLIVEYEKLKDQFTSSEFENIADRIRAFEEKKKEKYFGSGPTLRQSKIIDAFKGGNSMVGAEKKTGIGIGIIYREMENLKKKGYLFKEIKKYVYTVENIRNTAIVSKLPDLSYMRKKKKRFLKNEI